MSTTAPAGCLAARTSPSPSPREPARDLLVRLAHARTVDPGGPRCGRQRRVGRSALRLARLALPRTAGRRACRAHRRRFASARSTTTSPASTLRDYRRGRRAAADRHDARRERRPLLPGALSTETCDFWQATLPTRRSDVHWFRFIVSDGAVDGLLRRRHGSARRRPRRDDRDPRDWSYALTVYDPSFTTPAWAKNAVVYQIFPDRFRNGDAKNDPKTGDVRYDRPPSSCRGTTSRRAIAARTRRRARGGSTPPAPISPTGKARSGRDYFGGDLKGVRQ